MTEEIPTFVPFPYTISYIVTSSIAIGMKCLFMPTLLPTALMGFGSVLEVFSVATLVGVGFVEETAAAGDESNTTDTTTRLLQS